MKTKREIINETAATYSSKNLSIARGKCSYRMTMKGKVRKCAVGRCLRADSVLFSARFNINTAISSLHPNGVCLEAELKPSYRGHTQAFWGALQGFHDDRENWTLTGLSEKGEENKEKLLKEWGQK